MKREIVFLARGVPRHGLGGMEIVVWDLAREFVRLGYAVRVITTALSGINTEFEEEGVTIVPLQNTPSNRYSRAWWRESRRYFESHCKASTLAVMSVSAAGFGLLPIKQELPGIPFIMQAHGTSWGEVLSKWGSRRFLGILSSVKNLGWLPKDLIAYRKFDAIVAVGERVYRDLTSPPVSWMVPNNKIHLISNGIDTNQFCPSGQERIKLRSQLNLDEKTPIIISASRLHAQKGLGNGLRAFASLIQRQPDAIYMIAGDGPDKTALQNLATELGISNQVFFLGALQRAEMARYFQAADVFLFLTDRVEGLALNVLEALAVGLPAVISGHLQVFPSSALTLVNQKDPDFVAMALLNHITHFGQLYKGLLPEDYTLNICARNYIDLINNLAKS